MSARLEVEHITTYRYARPVSFGQHKLMYRPRAGHDITVLSDTVEVNVPHTLDWVLDTQSNSVAVITPQEAADELRIACRFSIIHHGLHNLDLPLAPHARRWPFDYSGDERRDLGATLEPHYPDPEGRLYEWMRPFVTASARPDTRQLLVDMTHAIRSGLRYAARDTEGTQTPHQTLVAASGTCRDFALLMMEAVRRLGMAARFVSGYLYDPALDADADGDGAPDVTGAGATHAWLQVYLPVAGWVPFDPTNSIFDGASLIRVAFARDPRLAQPLTGSWSGDAADFKGMDVTVEVRRRCGGSGQAR